MSLTTCCQKSTGRYATEALSSHLPGERSTLRGYHSGAGKIRPMKDRDKERGGENLSF